MADLDEIADDDLLLLAGGDAASSDESHVEPEHHQSRSPSPIASPVKDTTEKSPSPAPPKGLAKRKSVATTKTTARKRRRTDSEEDGEASSAPSSPNHSLASAAEPESESDTSPGDMVDLPAVEFPLEGKFRDAKDKAAIMAMTEIKREEVLAERAQAAEEQSQKLALRRMLAQRGREEENKKKRKATDADDAPRKSTRTKAAKTNETLEAYKRQREQRGRERRRGEDRKARDRRSQSKDSDADAEGESEVEWDDGHSKPAAIEQPPADLRDYQRIRIGRFNFPVINFTPGFEEKVIGCFARVNVGIDRATGENSYRMCRINGVTEGRPYAMEGSNGKTFVTDQYIILSQGKQEKEFPMIACSQSDFTNREFERYKIEMANASMKLPTKSALLAALDHIHQLLNHRWTDADIESKLRRSGIAQAKISTFERDRLTRERKAAVTRDDADALARIDGELAALEGPKLAFGTSLHPHNSNSSSGGGSSAVKATSKDAARPSATEAVRKAQLAEKRAKEKAQAEAARKRKAREEEEARKAALNPLFDEVGSNAGSRAGTPGAAERKEKAREREKKAGVPTFKKKAMDDEIIGSMDLGIDIDI